MVEKQLRNLEFSLSVETQKRGPETSKSVPGNVNEGTFQKQETASRHKPECVWAGTEGRGSGVLKI